MLVATCLIPLLKILNCKRQFIRNRIAIDNHETIINSLSSVANKIVETFQVQIHKMSPEKNQ